MLFAKQGAADDKITLFEDAGYRAYWLDMYNLEKTPLSEDERVAMYTLSLTREN